MKETKKSSI